MSRRLPLSVVSVSILLFLTENSLLHAQQLQWETEQLAFQPSPAATEIVAHFKFKNTGAASAIIKSVNSSCSCTTPTMRQQSFAPGEAGEVTVTYTIGTRTGVQEQTIAVASNDPQRPFTLLRIKVTIPEMVQLHPDSLKWSPAEPRTPKVIMLEVAPTYPVTTITVQSSNPLVAAKVETVTPGTAYRIIVTPGESRTTAVARLSIHTDYPPSHPKTYSAHIRVEPMTSTGTPR